MNFLYAALLGFLAGPGLAGKGLAGTDSVAPATPEAAAEWALTLPGNVRSQALQGIISGWAEADSAAAAQWTQKLPDQERWIMSSAIASWARKDPDAASAWALKIPEGLQRIQSLEQVGQAWGGQSRANAMVWAEKLPSETDRKAAIGGVIRSWAMQDHVTALKFAEEQSDAKFKEHLLGKVIYGWCFKDRAAAEKWVKDLPEGSLKKAAEKALAEAPVIRRRILPGSPAAGGESRKKNTLAFETPPELSKILESPLSQARQDALRRYVLEWFRRDQGKVIQWIPAKLQGYVLGVCAGAVAREWSKTDLAAAAEWMRQIPPFFRDFVARMGAEWATEQPKQVADAVLKGPDDSRGQVVIRGVCEAWAKKDPAAARAWVEALPEGEMRKGALKGLAIGWSQSDDAACRVWAEKITDENEKKEAKHYILHGLARSKPQEAIAYLKTLPNGDSDLNLFYCLGKEWALVDASAAADWAKSLPTGPKQESALQAVVRQWVYEDAKRSANWAENISEKESRSLAVKAIMEFWVEQNPTEALAWAQQIKDSERQLEALMLALIVWSRLDLQEATNWANNLPDGKQKTEILTQMKPATRQPVKQEKVKVGQDAPLFTTKTVDGKQLKLADYKGKFVLLDFWATWCGPCLGETPHLKAIFEKYGKREDFVLIGLSLDKDPAQPAAYAKENGCSWVDGFLGEWGKDEVTKLYGVRGIPSIWLIGPDGKVVAKNLRGDGIMAAVSGALEPKR